MKSKIIIEDILTFSGKPYGENRALYVIKILLPTFQEIYLNYDAPFTSEPYIEVDHSLDGQVWYHLTNEKTIQWTLLLAKIYRDKIKAKITINEETREVLDIQKAE
ncbi:hypothetical protein [uncultured Microscilla sp.]|uniref:hypothetical protein n=1 Tax=uncultured Microscilla sp. TaxID=432653 RepID=UPI002611264F|nr:hypothetical protein [uncultured Microscilla sp.]